MIPPKDRLTICFAHVAYPFQTYFAARRTGIASFQVRERKALLERIGEADVLLISGMWENGLITRAGKLRYIQSISAGVDQYPRDALVERGIRLASAQGANARAVAEHVIAMILALSRRLLEARDNQHRRIWRGMIGDPAQREDELGGKTLLVVGLGRIGERLAELGHAFGMRVIGIRRHPEVGGTADAVHTLAELPALLAEADFVALTCPLTRETENLIDAASLARMKPSAFLINVARGRCVDEPALIDALSNHRIAGAGIDVTWEEPLPPDSKLWAMENVFLTPHSAGETRRYEDYVLDILMENLDRLWKGETVLRNQVV